MHLLNRIIIITFLFGISYSAMSQKDSIPKNPFKDKLYTGGGLGLQIGDYTLIQVSPILGYNITENLSVGIGATYQYTKYRQYNYDFVSNMYGGSIFGRYIIWRSIFAYAEDELLNIEYREQVNNIIYKKRTNVNSLFVGGGVRQLVGENSAMVLMLLWNLNETPYTPYNNPIIRIGFEIGL